MRNDLTSVASPCDRGNGLLDIRLARTKNVAVIFNRAMEEDGNAPMGIQ